MKDIIPAKKQSPILGLTGMGGGVGSNIVAGGAAEKSYVDDVFSTYLYTGDGTNNKHIQNGVDLTEGGFVWLKKTDEAGNFLIVDSNYSMGSGGNLPWMASNAEGQYAGPVINSFESNGFKLHSNWYANEAKDYVSWAFRKSKGFFDIVSYSGDGTTRDIAHNLGCVPGMIMLKRTDNNSDWWTYHRDLGDTANPAWSKVLRLNDAGAQQDAYCLGSEDTHTSSTFRVGNDNSMNTNGASYVAYLFAGGESKAATATSIDLSGQEGIDIAASSSLNLGTGQFCVEGWIYLDDAPGTGSPAYGRFFQLDGPTVNAANTNLQITIQPSDKTIYVQNGSNGLISGTRKLQKQWNHIAVTRVSNTITVYVNGIPDGTASTAQDFNPNSGSPRVRLGYCDSTSNNNGVFQGKISNFRITTNEAVYTSAFKVPTEPLTTTSQGVTASNVKLLCCNGSSTTSSTVTPGTITAAGSPAASTNSPFDDPDGFKFGEDANQNLVKCGSYEGNGDTTNGTRVYVGFEPQWLLIKPIGFSEHWHQFDAMRGMVNAGNDKRLEVNQTGAETTTVDFIDINPDGFTVYFNPNVNKDNETFVYMAVRRPDGYVGKPAEAGTDVFAMDTGAGSSTIPNFDSGFPVDFATAREFAGAAHWNTGGRLIQGVYVDTDNNNSENGASAMNFESNVGWNSLGGWNSAAQSWMWKRGAGFDMVSYKGYNPSGIRDIPHNLNAVPEMIWMKARNYGGGWSVYHKGCNGGTNPEQYHLRLDNTNTQTDSAQAWADTAPTSTHWTVADDNAGNGTYNYIAMLFASVTGISKVGYFAGSDYSNTISLGFAPRFLLLKNIDATEYWPVYDSLRGWNNRIAINNSNAQATTSGWVTPTASGVTLIGNQLPVNKAGNRYIYYAHA